MKNSEPQKPSLKALADIRRKPVESSSGAIKTCFVRPGQAIPLVVQALEEQTDLATWGRANHGFVETLLFEHRAILFRGFNVQMPIDLKNFALATSDGPLLEYTDRSSPRREVGDGVYVSTIYPADRRIILHNEGTYWLVWPLKIYFCCLKPASQGGETPMADVRKVFNRLDPDLREGFMKKQVMYVRNYNDGFGLPWQEAFQTSSRSAAEAYGRKNAIEFEWKDEQRLRTRQVRRAVRKHPRTGEWLWFNHGAFFHISAREPEVHKGLLELFKEEDLPFMTYYGDGTPIDPAIVEQINDAYQKEKVVFAWQAGDVLLLDNMAIAHGREPYKGERQVIVAMSEPYREDD